MWGGRRTATMQKPLSEKVYFGRHWGSFDCPTEALVDAKFPKALANRSHATLPAKMCLSRVTRRNELECGLCTSVGQVVCPVCSALRHRKKSLGRGQRMHVADKVSVVTLSFLWTEAPRRVRPTDGAGLPPTT